MKKLILILLIGTFGTVNAQSPAVVVDKSAGWHKISEQTVNFKTETDEVVVMGADRFKAIKFKVTHGAIDLHDLKVHYSEGDVEDIQVRTPIAEGKESKQIDLKGSSRELNKVVFVYHTVKGSSSDKAHIELYGLK